MGTPSGTFDSIRPDMRQNHRKSSVSAIIVDLYDRLLNYRLCGQIPVFVDCPDCSPSAVACQHTRLTALWQFDHQQFWHPSGNSASPVSRQRRSVAGSIGCHAIGNRPPAQNTGWSFRFEYNYPCACPSAGLSAKLRFPTENEGRVRGLCVLKLGRAANNLGPRNTIR